MSRHFERLVCQKFAGLLSAEGFSRSSGCVYEKSKDATIATVAFVGRTSNRADLFVPRLSIGLLNLGTEYAVISKDLVRSGNGGDPLGWYRWADEDAADIDAAREQLLAVGLPWIDQYTDLSKLELYLQENVVVKDEAPPFHVFWRLVGPRGAPSAPRINANNLKYLSYCREALGKLRDALDAWEEYGRALVFKEGSERQKAYDERLAALRSTIEK